jgi:hypothetical protein
MRDFMKPLAHEQKVKAIRPLSYSPHILHNSVWLIRGRKWEQREKLKPHEMRLSQNYYPICQMPPKSLRGLTRSIVLVPLRLK